MADEALKGLTKRRLLVRSSAACTQRATCRGGAARPARLPASCRAWFLAVAMRVHRNALHRTPRSALAAPLRAATLLLTACAARPRWRCAGGDAAQRQGSE
jgi:hypothetical protein